MPLSPAYIQMHLYIDLQALEPRAAAVRMSRGECGDHPVPAGHAHVEQLVAGLHGATHGRDTYTQMVIAIHGTCGS